jgi:SagB-type dehydrogenase family enzyme
VPAALSQHVATGADASPPVASSAEVTASMHAATSLRGVPAAAARPTRPTAAVPAPTVATSGTVVWLPAIEPLSPDWLRLIATRRSVRRYAGKPLALADLAAVLARMSAEAGPRLSAAVRIDVVAHAVADLPAGAWRYRPGAHALLQRRPLAASGRAASRGAGLDQDVIGDAAALFVLSIDRAAFAADPLGPARGYRHAFLEAGRVGERVYLEAAARGLGACAVGAFYDDEASALVGVDPAKEWVVHFAALGVR